MTYDEYFEEDLDADDKYLDMWHRRILDDEVPFPDDHEAIIARHMLSVRSKRKAYKFYQIAATVLSATGIIVVVCMVWGAPGRSVIYILLAGALVTLVLSAISLAYTRQGNKSVGRL